MNCTRAERAPAGYREFSTLPVRQQADEFRTFPAAKQVDFFIYEFNHVHPFSNGFAVTIAERGDDVAPYLLRRMNEEEGRNKLAVLYILKIMCEDDYLHDRAATLSAIRDNVSRISNPAVKQSAEEMVKSL